MTQGGAFQVVPAGAVQTVTTTLPTIGSLWSPEMFPEHIVTSIRAEDIQRAGLTTAVGFSPKGFFNNPLTQPAALKQPSMMPDGIAFDAKAGQFLTHQGTANGPSLYRWLLAVFKVDDPAKTGRCNIAAINGDGGGDWHNQPALRYENGKFSGQWEMPRAIMNPTTKLLSGMEKITVKVDCDNVVTDGSAWNIAITGRHYGRMYSRNNGQPHTSHSHPDMTFSTVRNSATTLIGPRSSTGDNRNIVIAELYFGQGEVSERFIKKLEGYYAHRYRQASLLPADHPYRKSPPLVEAEDFHHLYKFNLAEWESWRAANPSNSAAFKANLGGAPMPLKGYTRVFYEDWRDFDISISAGAKAGGANWYGPGWNTAVGGDEQGKNPSMPSPSTHPQLYEWDKERKYLKLINAYEPASGNTAARWQSPAIYLVDDAMRGRSFGDGYVFRVRCKYDKIDDPNATGGNLFWSIWGYSENARLWHQVNRLELDFIEPDANGPTYMNGCSSHVHEAVFQSFNPDPAGSRKLIGTNITVADGWPIDLTYWDGQWKVWEFRVDPDYTYINVDPTGATDPADRSNMIELYRFPTPREYLERFYFIINTCIRRGATDWEPALQTQKLDGEGNRLFLEADGTTLTTTDTGTPAMEPARYRNWIDWIEVLQRDEIVYPVTPPAPFGARPTITRSGNKLTVNPHFTENLEFFECYWHRDGYRVVSPTGLTYDLTDADAGANVAVMVKATGWVDMPEAWSNPFLIAADDLTDGETPHSAPTPGFTNPTIAVTSGSGYAGSILTVMNGGPGNWQVDTNEDGTGWDDIEGATGTTYTRTLQDQGLPLRWRRGSDGAVSGVNHMWMPNDLGSEFITANGAAWLDYKRSELLSLSNGAIVSAIDGFGSGRAWAARSSATRPAWGLVDGYGAAIYPNTLNSFEQHMVGSTPWAPAFVAMVMQYKDGEATTFDAYNTLFADPGTNSAHTSHRIMGQQGASDLYSAKIWTDSARINGAPAAAGILPLPRSIVTFSGTPVSAAWGIGGRNGSNNLRSWQGPIFEMVALAAVPTGDALDKLLACLAHRNGTIPALAANLPNNPYLVSGPQARM